MKNFWSGNTRATLGDSNDGLAMTNDTHHGFVTYANTNNLSFGFSAIKKLRFGIIEINDIHPTSAKP